MQVEAFSSEIAFFGSVTFIRINWNSCKCILFIASIQLMNVINACRKEENFFSVDVIQNFSNQSPLTWSIFFFFAPVLFFKLLRSDKCAAILWMVSGLCSNPQWGLLMTCWKVVLWLYFWAVWSKLLIYASSVGVTVLLHSFLPSTLLSTHEHKISNLTSQK